MLRRTNTGLQGGSPSKKRKRESSAASAILTSPSGGKYLPRISNKEAANRHLPIRKRKINGVSGWYPVVNYVVIEGDAFCKHDHVRFKHSNCDREKFGKITKINGDLITVEVLDTRGASIEITNEVALWQHMRLHHKDLIVPDTTTGKPKRIYPQNRATAAGPASGACSSSSSSAAGASTSGASSSSFSSAAREVEFLKEDRVFDRIDQKFKEAEKSGDVIELD